ncbi:MAG: restriction endonuclease subunit S, partial [Candidatus Cloacimonetes bacterium]|nr:restriction endonuclease subunit S [Candidatus Cloacimonadota bacterium]
CGFVNYMKTRFWQGGHCYSINTDQNTLFLYYLLKNMELSIMSLRVGSGLPNIQKNRLSELNLEIPSTSEQSVIANTLFDLEKEIQSYKAILEKYCLIKLGMMQVLLTGRIRLI